MTLRRRPYASWLLACASRVALARGIWAAFFLSDLGTVGRFGLRHSKSRPARTWRGPVTGEMGCVVFVKLDGFRLLVTAEVLGGTSTDVSIG